MGLLSGLKKGVKNIFKGAKKIVKKVGHGFKKFFSSKAFKIMLIAAAIYVGYGLATQGAVGATGTASAAGTTGATTGAEWAATSMNAPAMGGATTAAAATPGAISGTLPANQPAGGADWAASSMKAPVMSGPSVATTAAENTPGFFSKAGAFMNKNPMASYGMMNIGGNMISSALAPNETDEQLRYDRESRGDLRIAGLEGGATGPIRIGNRTYG